MKVVEIFTSIDGEGIRTGLPVTFVRLFGCNLNCSYCDTPYSHSEEEDKVKTMSVDEIVECVLCREVRRVTITGGEPLIHPGIKNLICALVANGCEVNVETNGTMPVPDEFRETKHVFFTMDYKSISSGMNGTMSLGNLNTLRCNDALKFVVGTQEDMDDMLHVIDALECNPSIYVSPVFGEIEPAEIVDYMLRHKLYDIKVQVQLHKVIWSPNQRGV